MHAVRDGDSLDGALGSDPTARSLDQAHADPRRTVRAIDKVRDRGLMRSDLGAAAMGVGLTGLLCEGGEGLGVFANRVGKMGVAATPGRENAEG
jgi:hypothetical protein